MRPIILLAALALCGCATTYQLQLMPRDSGRMYSGTAEDTGRGEGPISIAIDDRTYNGTWVATTPDRTSGYVSGGFGFGRRGGMGVGTMITMDNPAGGEGKALLSSSDGAGLRCDFKSGQGRGGGVCRDDRGREYDVQIRAAEKR
jgi:hypothetical protein